MTRRRAFSVVVQGLGGVAGAVVVLPAVGFALAPVFDREEEIWQSVGPPDEFSPETYTPRVITLVEGIGEVGKTTVYIRRGNTELSQQEPDLPQEAPDDFIAISTRCAHAGCPVRFVQAAGEFICPCHGGVYDFQGKVIGGPPVRPLDRFQTRMVGGQVQVGPRYSVTSQLEPVRARDPGEFVGGIWEYIYPPRPSVPPPPSS
jgi:menaquinol-cytochrome c reductase iron-sulfur subunit